MDPKEIFLMTMSGLLALALCTVFAVWGVLIIEAVYL